MELMMKTKPSEDKMKRQRFSMVRFIVVGGVFGLAVQLCVFGATLKNRWSFEETEGTVAADSVGGQNGVLVGAGAYFVPGGGVNGSGTVYIDNGAGVEPRYTDQCDYVAFPENIVTGYTAIAVEAWVYPVMGGAGMSVWSRIFDFGNSDGTSGTRYFFMRAGTTGQAAGGEIAAPWPDNAQSFYPAGAILNDKNWNHVVWCSDGASGRLWIYVNGVLAGMRDGFTNTPALVGPTTNNWLGRSQFSADPGLCALYDEFRIYDGALDPLEVAANYYAGPTSYPASYGTVTNIQLEVPSPVAVGATAPVVLWASASGLPDALNIADTPAPVTYWVENSNVATVNSRGLVTGIGAGTTLISATYAGLSVTQSVQVIALPTRMIHRYSFTSDASDSIGGKHGTLMGNATISNGQVLLDGVSGTYVDLPAFLIHPTNVMNKAVTFEAWFTAYPQNGAWTRLFDFGDKPGNQWYGSYYIFFAPNNAANGGSARLAVSDASPGYNGEDGFNVAHVLGRTNLHLVAVFNPNPNRRFLGLYLNGSYVASITTTKSYNALNNVYSWLGRSLYDGDSWLSGAINEFRIYDGELDRFQIAASYQAGPDTTNFNVGNFVALRLDPRSSTIPLDQVRQVSCTIDFEFATNINLLGDANLSLRSSDTNILTITAGGLIQARRLGQATLTAQYTYVVGATTNVYVSSTNVTVVVLPSTLAHRYTFNEGDGLLVYDVVGGAHGQIKAGTNELGVTNFVWAPAGQLTINTNTALGAQDTYVELPAGILTGMGSEDVSFEFWATPLSGAAYQRVFDFGSVPGSPTNAAEPNVFFARGPWWASTTPYYDWVNGNLSAGAVWANGVPAHFVVVHSGTVGTAKIYRDGALVATSTTQNLPISSINDIYCFIGRSIYSWPISKPGGWFDPYWMGSFDEFRMYKGLLTDAEVVQQYTIGPDQVIASVPLSYSRDGNNLVLSWPRYAVHFVLESAPVLGPGATWTPVNGTVIDTGSELRMTVPITGTQQYFRLKR